MDMTRAEVLKSYRVNAYGRIISPGKFEGEMVYMPHFYEASLDGLAESVFPDEECPDFEVMVIPVCPSDRKEYPELGDSKHVAFYVREDGFVCECSIPE